MKNISREMKEGVDSEGLAAWLDIDTGGIRTYCKIESNDPAQCYRKLLVELYCERTAKSPQQVAEDMAWVLKNEMENRIVAKKLRLLNFGEL